MTATEPFTPRSLRDIVAAGDNPLDYMAPGHDVQNLIETLQRCVRTPRCGREQEAANFREHLEWMLRERCTPILWGDGERRYEGDPDDGVDGFGFARVVQMWQWEVDINEDPSLIDQVVGLLPPAERLAAGVSVDQARHANPLEVQSLEAWGTCDGCGAELAPGSRAVGIGAQPEFSDEKEYEYLTWCRACVTAAVVELSD